MAEVYKFKVKLNEFEDYLWRDIEITSVSSIAKLSYAVLAVFDAKSTHLFCIESNENHYEFMFDGFEDFGDVISINPAEIKLSQLKLKIGDCLTMDYDYGAGWRFNIELLSVTEMKKGTGTHYPYITDGAGRGIIEDIGPGTLAEYIDQTNTTNVLPTYYDFELGREIEWDYRKFDLKSWNVLYKSAIEKIQETYEDFND